MGKIRIAASLAASAALLGGCWGQIGGNAEHTRHNVVDGGVDLTNVDQVGEQWSVPLDATQLSEPVVLDGRVFLNRHAAQGVFVDAFAVGSGAPLWETDITDYRGSASPVAVSGDELWIGDLPGFCDLQELRRLDPATGDLLVGEPSLVTTPVVTGGGVVAYLVNEACMPSTPHTLVVRDAETGTELWRYPFPEDNVVGDSSPPGASRSDQLPMIADGRIFVANADTVYAFAATGCGSATCSPQWSQDYPEETLLAPVALPDGVVLVRTNEVNLDGSGLPKDESSTYALAGDTGAEVWERHWLGQLRSTVVAEHTMVHAFDVTGDWPTPFTGYIVATSMSGDFDLWWAEYGDRAPAQLAAAGDIVYAGLGASATDTDGRLDAFVIGGCGQRPAPCPPALTLPTRGAPKEMSVAGGQVFVASQVADEAMALTAYGLP